MLGSLACDPGYEPEDPGLSVPPDAGESARGEQEELDPSGGELDDPEQLADPEPVGPHVALVAHGGLDGGLDGSPQIQYFTDEDLPPSFLATTTDDFAVEVGAPLTSSNSIPEPPGYGHYCSMVWPGGGWAFASDTLGAHPCQYLRDTFGNGTVRKAGLFDASGTNQTVLWCDGQSWGPAIYRGASTGPLTAAFNAAVGSGEPNCVITASPLELPIFDWNPGIFGSAGTGVDFAREGALFMDTGWFGAVGVHDHPAATQVSFRGHAKSGFIDDHDGWDWGAAEGADLYSMANGYIIRSRDYQTSATACGSAMAATVAAREASDCINRDYAPYWPAPCTGWNDPSLACQNAFMAGNYIDYQNPGWDGSLQGEVYVRHMIQTAQWEYRESFVVGYFHVQRGNTPPVWSTVGPGTQIADVGNGGWTSGPHLHMTVVRETNVGTPNIKDRWFSTNPDNCTGCAGGSHNFHRYAVDPYGWSAPLNIDPRGWMTTDGAMSPDLWAPSWYHLWFGLPPTGAWGT
ncbi:MAG: hypothetical protein AAGF11_15435 [Myxococcota bacterium]